VMLPSERIKKYGWAQGKLVDDGCRCVLGSFVDDPQARMFEANEKGWFRSVFDAGVEAYGADKIDGIVSYAKIQLSKFGFRDDGVHADYQVLYIWNDFVTGKHSTTEEEVLAVLEAVGL
jgi:hypothetical protein